MRARMNFQCLGWAEFFSKGVAFAISFNRHNNLISYDCVSHFPDEVTGPKGLTQLSKDHTACWQ